MEYKFRPRGGMEGYAPTRREMVMATRERVLYGIAVGHMALPLGDPKAIETCRHQKEVYFEREIDGVHGWACANCGLVTQWG